MSKAVSASRRTRSGSRDSGCGRCGGWGCWAFRRRCGCAVAAAAADGPVAQLSRVQQTLRVEALLHLDDLRRQGATGFSVLHDEDVRIVDAHAALAVHADD